MALSATEGIDRRTIPRANDALWVLEPIYVIE
jgi:hypothetical protein